MLENNKKELQVSEKKSIEQAQGELTHEGAVFMPQVDIVENADAITLRADLPGVKKENVQIDVNEGVLTLMARVTPLPNNLQPVYAEYEVGNYSRRFTLGERIETGKIDAQMQDGVLTLTLPKAEKHKPRKIDVR